MGIRFERTGVIARGKREEALEFAARVSSYVEENFDKPVTWGIEVGGTLGKIHWYADYENMTELEAVLGHTMVDDGYLKLVDSAADLFESAPEDTLVYTM